MKRITIYDIAKEVGVSPSTVSRAFNDASLVSEDKINKIRDTAERLGYRQDMIAKSLRTKKTGSIALLVPDVLNPFFPEIIKAVEDVAKRHRYNVFLGNTDLNYDTQNWYVETFIERGVDGVLFVGITGGRKDEECYEKLIAANIPCILIDRYIKSPKIPYVGSDNFSGGYKAGTHLVDIGHKNIATITGSLSIELNIDRLNGFKKALQEKGINLSDSLIFESDFTALGGYHSMEKILNLPKPPTATFIMSDGMAIGALVLLKSKRVRIPEEMAIVGFDDIPIASLLSTPLTTVAQRMYDMGARAANVLTESIRKKTMPNIQLILDVNLIIRNSTVKDINTDIMLTKYGYIVNKSNIL
jgi:DNA-binding LacI/PurR family transcriptional regulator